MGYQTREALQRYFLFFHPRMICMDVKLSPHPSKDLNFIIYFFIWFSTIFLIDFKYVLINYYRDLSKNSYVKIFTIFLPNILFLPFLLLIIREL